jgi:hypothetical protein
MAYAACFILCGSPVAQGYQDQILLTMLAIKNLISCYEDEVDNAGIFLSNMVIVVSAVVKSSGLHDPFLNTFVVVIMLASCLRFVLDEKTRPPLYILPLFLILCVNSHIQTACVFIYATGLFLLARPKEKTNAVLLATSMLVPFIDGLLFYTITPRSSLPNIGWPIIILLSCCIAIPLEKIAKKDLKNKITLRTTILFLLTLGSVLYPTLLQGEPMVLNSPVPVFVAIPILILNGIYLKIFSKIKAKALLSKVTRSAKTFFNHNKATMTLKKSHLSKTLRPTGRFILYTEEKITNINISKLAGIFITALIVILVYLELSK